MSLILRLRLISMEEVLQKAMLEAVKVLKDAGYTVDSKSISEIGSTVTLNIVAVEPEYISPYKKYAKN